MQLYTQHDSKAVLKPARQSSHASCNTGQQDSAHIAIAPARHSGHDAKLEERRMKYQKLQDQELCFSR